MKRERFVLGGQKVWKKVLIHKESMSFSKESNPALIEFTMSKFMKEHPTWDNKPVGLVLWEETNRTGFRIEGFMAIYSLVKVREYAPGENDDLVEGVTTWQEK